MLEQIINCINLEIKYYDTSSGIDQTQQKQITITQKQTKRAVIPTEIIVLESSFPSSFSDIEDNNFSDEDVLIQTGKIQEKMSSPFDSSDIEFQIHPGPINPEPMATRSNRVKEQTLHEDQGFH